MNKQSHSLALGDDRDVEAFLAERIYEYNAEQTGYFDGESFNVVQRDDEGNIRSGLYGHTWGGCCYLSHLWVHASLRGSGLGRALLTAAEDHARSRGCAQVILASHSFQAPNFYAKHGYELKGVIEDDPLGYSSVMLVKTLKHRAEAEFDQPRHGVSYREIT